MLKSYTKLVTAMVLFPSFYFILSHKLLLSNPVGAYPFDLEFTEDCGILIVSNKGKATREGSQYRDPEGTLTKIQLGADFSDATPIVSSTIAFSDYFSGEAGLQNYMYVIDPHSIITLTGSAAKLVNCFIPHIFRFTSMYNQKVKVKLGKLLIKINI